jgi:hypothetical protein
MSSKIEPIVLKLEMRNIVPYFGHSAAFCLVIITCSCLASGVCFEAEQSNKAKCAGSGTDSTIPSR